jgi:YesN/AraC family two-component response regulator
MMKIRFSKPRTLYGQLLVSFICIIVLFSLFNGLLFSFFQSRLQKDVVANNHRALIDVSERYETHIAQLKALLNTIYNDTAVREFNRQLRSYGADEANYLSAYRISNMLRADAYNPLFYLEGIIVHYGIGDFAVDQDGSSSASDMFGRAYASPGYSHSFWRDQLSSPSFLTLFPARRFLPSSDVANEPAIMPISLKLPGEEYQVIALLNVDKAMSAFTSKAAGRSIAIADNDGQMLYQNGLPEGDIPVFNNGSYHLLHDQFYWFRTTTADGLSYYSTIPYATASAELRQWFWWSAAVFVCTLLLATAVSHYFSRRIKRPVDRLLAAAAGQSSRLHPAAGSGIREYEAIESRILQLMEEREEVQGRMKRHRSILTSYGYMSRIKNINEDLGEWKEFMTTETDGSYDLILYELKFRGDAMARLNIRPEHASLAVREHIRAAVERYCPGSHTFQLEHHQILTVVRNGRSEPISTMLAEVKELLDQSFAYCAVTIAVSSRFEHASQFGHAYEQVRSWAGQALPEEETQLITAPRELPETPRLSEKEADKLASSLQAGQAEAAVGVVDELLERMRQSGAAVRQYHEVAEGLATMLTDELRHLGDEAEPQVGWTVRSIRRDLAVCHTVGEYRLQLARLAETVAVALSMRTVSGEDPVISRVMHSLETGFGSDISLEQVADDLNMSAAYLSTYIKEKTGTNFIDHLNGLRMAKAKELLTETARQVSDIAREVGYLNVTSFNRLFKKTTGISPTEYRRLRQVDAEGKTG